ncbi:MAG: phenylacetate--CoA ligase family protein [Bacteroidales bacterium]|nr:phenylacetate--CoA ligase family protein [Bacteroidales bacterium]
MGSSLKEFFLLKIILPIIDLTTGTKITYWLRQITVMNSMSGEQRKAWQTKKLQQFILHAYNNTPYYHQLFNQLSLKPEDISSLEDLTKIPPIDKNIIRENYGALIPANIKKIPHKKGRTGGTTGMPLHYLYDEDTWGYITAAKIYAWKTAGYKYGEKFVTIGSSSLFPTHKKSWKHIIYFFIRNGIPLNGMNISDEVAENYVNLINKRKVKYIYGYAASIYLLTKYISDRKIKMPGIKGVFTTSEVLTPQYRALMEKTYNCPVMDCYGARDAGITAYEISPGSYHVGYNALAEIENPYAENTGTLLVTNILNYSFPLIRYRLGDDVCLAHTHQAGYNGQLISRVVGRTSEVMRLDNGHNLTSTGFSIMIRDFNVLAFKMTKVNGLKIRLEIQPKPEFSDNECAYLLKTMKKHVGNEVEVEIIYVNSFEPLENGKRQYFIT